MWFVKVSIFYLFMIQTCSGLQTQDFPPDVAGVARYNYFREYLPEGSKGVYKILAPDDCIKYIGSSRDINRRLAFHYKKGLLELGDSIMAIIFHPNARQAEVLDYERVLIGKYKPSYNKHTGAPGRVWRSEQILKLKIFYDHNSHLLKPEAQIMIRNLLNGNGKILHENYKMMRSMLYIMKCFH